MASQLVDLCFAANDPLGLARFWATALRWDVANESGDGVGVVPTDGTGFLIRLDQDEETAIRAPGGTGPFITWGGPPLLPKPPKNRLHLDIAPVAPDDQQAEVDRLVALGATRLDIGQGDAVGVAALADPDGNELCVLRQR
jgi:hypothetical protein